MSKTIKLTDDEHDSLIMALHNAIDRLESEEDVTSEYADDEAKEYYEQILNILRKVDNA